MRNNHRLPYITDKPFVVFDQTDFLLARVEELFIYVIEINKKIKELEKCVS
jgi:hypothetical protein